MGECQTKGRVWGVLYGMLGVIVVIPIPEAILGLAEQMLQMSGIAAYFLALTISLGVMGIEYYLIGKLDKKIRPTIQSWLISHGSFRGLGYLSIVVCSVNPVPVFPLTRTTAILIWQEMGLVSGGYIIALLTAIRLWLVRGGFGMLLQ